MKGILKPKSLRSIIFAFKYKEKNPQTFQTSWFKNGSFNILFEKEYKYIK